MVYLGITCFVIAAFITGVLFGEVSAEGGEANE